MSSMYYSNDACATTQVGPPSCMEGGLRREPEPTHRYASTPVKSSSSPKQRSTRALGSRTRSSSVRW
ncbi:hypothetical protein BGW80DRAFT_1293182 [Lactifluus volemus]|nr:hypothetical protein BGW80DRAFT_1293182 [Lactifluus volemus]